MDFMDTIHENPWEANYIETGYDQYLEGEGLYGIFLIQFDC